VPVAVTNTLSATQHIATAPAPTTPDQLTRKDYVDAGVQAANTYADTRTPRVRYKSVGGLATYAGGDTQIPVTGGTTNIGGWTISSNLLVAPRAGTYAISFTFGTNPHTAASAVALGAGGFTVAFPAQPGTAWRIGGTFIATLAAGSSIGFTYRNAGASVNQALSTEVVMLADW
jgi:hypothetical protein